ncbi:hypothetical protein M378DRAFT_162997 [Amanita muscaria Koide BX008]|uniref:Uncharacterized protein n=1 Tax=Amanita muscaria (strain Koide BX008) TaxID=946122 RepID=A0A0C2SMW5_AMAMK|nr:hypothetical protein M378DRAFT_162997 [Amanita muscaria Koide BX008]
MKNESNNTHALSGTGGCTSVLCDASVGMSDDINNAIKNITSSSAAVRARNVQHLRRYLLFVPLGEVMTTLQ